MALTPSQVEHYRRLLVARRDELAMETARVESEVTEQNVVTMSGGAPSRVAR